MIDLGTNSVKLLVAEVEGPGLRPVWEEANQTRLGEGFYKTHLLQPRAIARTARAVADFAAKARSHGVSQPRLIATSAARDAVNRDDLLEALRPVGLHLEIISGEQEAEWAYQGVCTDPAFAGRRLLIIEVGGGSTQFILGQGGHRSLQRSFPLGAVRLLERFYPSDPPLPSELKHCREWLHDFMLERVKPLLGEVGEADGKDTLFLGAGGTAAILARMEISLDGYDRERIEAARLSRRSFEKWVLRLWSLPLAQRRQIPGLPAARADVILTGAAIYEAAMENLGFAEFRVSTRGLRFGALLNLAPAETAPSFSAAANPATREQPPPNSKATSKEPLPGVCASAAELDKATLPADKPIDTPDHRP